MNTIFISISILIIIISTTTTKAAATASKINQVSSLERDEYYNKRYRSPRFREVVICRQRKRETINNRQCFRQCQTDKDCRGSKRRCLCDGECGLSCVKISKFLN
jgi:anaerobic C4-dicarboxylate transporter